MIPFRYSLVKDPVPESAVDIEVHTQLHSAIRVNSLIDKVLDSPLTNEKNIVIPGSAKFSDLSSPISVIKSRVKRLLFETQQLKPPGCKIEWLPINRWGCSPQ